MADERVQYEVAAKFTGEGELRRGAAEFDRLADKSKAALTTTTAQGPIAAAGNAWRGMAVGLGVAGAAYFAVSQAASKAYATLREGAVLATTAERFEKLAVQINSTGDALLGKLREATKGMISDAELMASASGIVSLRLAENEDQVVRLATVVGTLGWDMQQVILTFANLSTMRLDALGLSVEEVKTKQKELMQQGMSTAAAFKEAVIQAGEARLDVGGVSELEASLKRIEAQAINAGNAFKLNFAGAVAEGLDEVMPRLAESGVGAEDAAAAVGERVGKALVGALGPTAMELIIQDLRSQLAELTGSEEQAAEMVSNIIKEVNRAGIAQHGWKDGIFSTNVALENQAAVIAAVKSEVILADVALQASQDSWMRTGDIAVAAMKAAREETRRVAAEINAVFAGVAGFDEIGTPNWFGEPGEGFDYLAAGARAGANYRSGLAIQARQARVDQNLAFVRHDPDFIEAGREVRQEMEYATEAAYAYGGALSYVDVEAQKAAEAHSRFMASFNAELRAKPEDGLYNAEGVANVEAVNKALYEQVEAAGASAATLALLGVATGQFTQEQAEAALKAAVLGEQIKAIAESVAAGDLSIGDALGQLNQAREALDAANLEAVAGTGENGVQIAVTADTSTAETNLDATASQLDALTAAEYTTAVGMDISGVVEGATQAKTIIGSIPDTKTLTIRWEQSGVDVITALRALGIIV